MDHANKQTLSQMEQDLSSLKYENEATNNIRTNLEKVINEYKYQEKKT